MVSIRYTGMLKNETELETNTDTNGWSGAVEKYVFERHGNSTLLKIDFDSTEEYSAYFTKTYPEALEKIKSLCEK